VLKTGTGRIHAKVDNDISVTASGATRSAGTPNGTLVFEIHHIPIRPHAGAELIAAIFSLGQLKDREIGR
jgi:hypothetical protein